MAMDRPTSARSMSSLRSDSIPYPQKPTHCKKTFSETPTSLDAKYLVAQLGSTLTEALKEVAETRPWDPIEYLAQWLYNYSAETARKKADGEEKYKTEMEQVEAEREKIRKRRHGKEETRLVLEEGEKLKLRQEQEKKEQKTREEEQKRLKELEELQKKQREGSDTYAQRPDLATVSEEADQTEMLKKRLSTNNIESDKSEEPEDKQYGE